MQTNGGRQVTAYFNMRNTSMIDLKEDRRESQTKLTTHIGRRNKTIEHVRRVK